MVDGRALIVQSGGPSPVFGESLNAAVQTFLDYGYGLDDVVLAFGGAKGLIDGNLVLMSTIWGSEQQARDYFSVSADFPGAELGTSRDKFHDTVEVKKGKGTKRVPDHLKLGAVHGHLDGLGISHIAMNGGDGSLRRLHYLLESGKRTLYGAHLPKTVDGDIGDLVNGENLNFVTPGLLSAGLQAANNAATVARDHASMQGGYVDIYMGKLNGWLPLFAMLSRAKIGEGGIYVLDTEHLAGPDLVFIAEMYGKLRFNEKDFMKTFVRAYEQNNGYVNAALSEGCMSEKFYSWMRGELHLNGDLSPEAQKEFTKLYGKHRLSRMAALKDYIQELIVGHPAFAGADIRVRTHALGVEERCSVQSAIDKKIAYESAAYGVTNLIQGRSGTVLIGRPDAELNFPYRMHDLASLAEKSQKTPKAYFDHETHLPTPAFMQDMMPLISRELVTSPGPELVHAPLLLYTRFLRGEFSKAA